MLTYWLLWGLALILTLGPPNDVLYLLIYQIWPTMPVAICPVRLVYVLLSLCQPMLRNKLLIILNCPLIIINKVSFPGSVSFVFAFISLRCWLKL